MLPLSVEEGWGEGKKTPANKAPSPCLLPKGEGSRIASMYSLYLEWRSRSVENMLWLTLT